MLDEQDDDAWKKWTDKFVQITENIDAPGFSDFLPMGFSWSAKPAELIEFREEDGELFAKNQNGEIIHRSRDKDSFFAEFMHEKIVEYFGGKKSMN